MKVPKPRKLPSGQWHVQVMVDKVRISVTEPTEQLCKDKALLLKAQGRNGLLKLTKPTDITLYDAIDNYILLRSNVLAESTIAGYKEVQRNRFKTVMNVPVSSVTNWQAVVNNEAALVSPKTVKNAWSTVHSALLDAGVPSEQIKVKLPKIPKSDRPWLQPEEIKVFLDAIKGKECELPALLALHSLRRSEIYAVKKENISSNTIHVRGAMIRGENGYVQKKTNKSNASSRDVPIMIPRLKELLKQCGDGYLCTEDPTVTYKRINKVCREAGLREVGFHGLRHSFASLCYHLEISAMEAARLGGWDDVNTMFKIYTHLAEVDKTEAARKLKDFFA